MRTTDRPFQVGILEYFQMTPMIFSQDKALRTVMLHLELQNRILTCLHASLSCRQKLRIWCETTETTSNELSSTRQHAKLWKQIFRRRRRTRLLSFRSTLANYNSWTISCRFLKKLFWTCATSIKICSKSLARTG